MKTPDRPGNEAQRSRLLASSRVPTPVPAPQRQATNLRICPSCSSPHVYPLDWDPVDACHWRVELRCPECEWTETAVHEQEILDRFDHDLDAATDSLINDLRTLQRLNMVSEIDQFVAALHADLILPEDF